MSDWWSKWFRRRRWPLFRGWFFEDVDEVFKEIEEIMESEFKELSKRVPKELIRERVLPNGTKIHEWGPFVYGYSISIGPDGKTKVREFGNMKRGTRLGRPRIDIKGEREPLIDIITTNGEVKVIAELPGVDKEDIKLYGTEKSLSITVNTSQRRYFKEVKLPTKVDSERAKSTYKNGVLEVTFPKKKEERSKSESIKIK